MVNYIVDEDGIKTHAVIPIDEWEKMQINIPEKSTSFFNSQLATVTAFIKDNNHLNINEWKEAYEKHFSYYKKLEFEDFLALHLLRTSYITDARVQDNIVLVPEGFGFSMRPVKWLLEKDGTVIKEKSLKLLKDAKKSGSEKNFLEVFHQVVYFDPDLIADYRSDYQRLRRDAERDRLFIYDLDSRYAVGAKGNDKEFEKIFTNDDDIIIGDLRRLIRKYLAKRLYNGNLSRISRAASEGEERINSINI